MSIKLKEVFNNNQFNEAVEGFVANQNDFTNQNYQEKLGGAFGGLVLAAIKTANTKGKDINYGELPIQFTIGDKDYYYIASIKNGSLEEGFIDLNAKKVTKEEFENYFVNGRNPEGTKTQAKIKYDANTHKFSLEIVDENGESQNFTQESLDAGTLDHIKQGLETFLGGTYDMKGNVKDGNGISWKISFGTDSNYNIEYMTICNPNAVDASGDKVNCDQKMQRN